MQIATIDIFSTCVLCQVAYCVREAGVETIGGGWLTCKAIALFPGTHFSKYYIQNLLLISGFEEFRNLVKKSSRDMRFFFVIIKSCSNTGFCLLTNLGLFLFFWQMNEPNAYGNTPLHVACYNGQDVVVNELIDCGANVNQMNEKGFTPLHFAAASTHGALCLELLVCNGADVNMKVGESKAIHALLKV